MGNASVNSLEGARSETGKRERGNKGEPRKDYVKNERECLTAPEKRGERATKPKRQTLGPCEGKIIYYSGGHASVALSH